MTPKPKTKVSKRVVKAWGVISVKGELTINVLDGRAGIFKFKEHAEVHMTFSKLKNPSLVPIEIHYPITHRKGGRK